MVYMKKSTPAKNQQQFKKGKKAVQAKQEEDNDFEDMDDSDDDVDSDDEAPQLTPANKGTKGRQSMSEKKVSFSIPGTPAGKTPKNSALAKKQPTPANKGRTSMQEFKGMKGKQAQDEDDSDEDSEDDDDVDLDDGDDLEIDEGDDLDLDLAEGDDDEDDSEDDDEEDDDDDEEDDKANIQKKLSVLKQTTAQQNKQKTPVKGNDKAKAVESPAKGQSPKKEQASVEHSEEVDRRRQRDAKMLYIGGLPTDTTEDELKSLSSDIVDVTLPLGNRKNPNTKTIFAFLCFNNEAKAESNYKTLQSKKFRGQPLTLDFVGFKSKNKKAEDESTYKFNLKKLFVAGIPLDVTIDQLAKYFKKAHQISINRSPVFRTATISFDDEADCKEAHDANREVVLSGHKLPVLYSRMSGQSDSRKRKNRNRPNKNNMANKNNMPNKNTPNKNFSKNGGNPAKKMKFSKPE